MVQKRFNYYCIHIWSLSHGTAYKLRAQAGAYRDILKIGHTIPITEGICGIVARTRKTYLSNDVSTEPQYTNLSLPIDTQSELSRSGHQRRRRSHRHHQRRERQEERLRRSTT